MPSRLIENPLALDLIFPRGAIIHELGDLPQARIVRQPAVPKFEKERLRNERDRLRQVISAIDRTIE